MSDNYFSLFLFTKLLMSYRISRIFYTVKTVLELGSRYFLEMWVEILSPELQKKKQKEH